MGFIKSVTTRLQPAVVNTEAAEAAGAPVPSQTTNEKDDVNVDIDVESQKVTPHGHVVESGVAGVEAIQALWGKKGKWLVIAGLGMVMIMYELDNTTVYVYQNYATSNFNALSQVATLGTAGSILFAVVKPPLSKISNIVGRGETYCFTILCYLLSYILCASAKDIRAYSAGYVLHVIGQSGTNIMNDIVISDITTARWRGLAIGLSFFPFLIIPWISAFITESVVGGIGWRWGIGMLAILMPFCASFIITTLLYYQIRAKKQGLIVKQKITAYDFCSQIDLGGTILFTAGFSMLLLPFTIASTATSKWSTPWLIVVLVLGCVCLIILPFYEKMFARYPLVPIHYFKNFSIVSAVLLIATDSLGFSCTHTYIFSWISISHNYGTRNATFYIFTNGIMQCLAGIAAGAYMLKTRRFKWLLMAAAVIRLIGYGIMIRLRGSDNSQAELFIVQLIQGLGSGIIQTAVLVSAQIQVSHSEMAQITALVICCSFLGSSVGASVAGGIYTGVFKDELANQLGNSSNSTLIDEVYNSMVGVVPVWGSFERIALNHAYSNVMRYMTYVALGSAVPSFFLVWFMPNVELPDKNNLVEG